MKTFWGWRDEQLPDGTVIWTLPDGQRYATTPGSALLFPTLCAPPATLPVVEIPRAERGTEHPDRTAMMPRRTRTRAQNRAAAITAERQCNHRARVARKEAAWARISGAGLPGPDDEPAPF